VCSASLDKENLCLGGEDEIIEIDESMFQRVKHYRGKDLKRKQLWVFGMKQRSNKKSILLVVRARNAATLLKIIYKHCKPGSVIYSDLWKAYKHISKFDKHFKHFTVNHSLHFVDPITRVHTNGIESVWRAAKQKVKQMGGIKRGYIQPYLDEFMFRSNNGTDEPFYLLIEAIKKCFPLNSPRISQLIEKIK
jgi:transposase-like protein